MLNPTHIWLVFSIKHGTSVIRPAGLHRHTIQIKKRHKREQKHENEKIKKSTGTSLPLLFVILGQDCYHRKGQAMGLAFSVPPNTKFPPSLRNISREMEIDLGVGLSSGDLTHWANQGVLLLNCALTVREKSPGSHTKIWQSVTNNIVKILSQTQTNICFLLWGKHAQSKACLIDPNKGHLVLEAGHPSPLSANRGGWFGNGHFSIVNSFLKSIEKEPIVWSDNANYS